ncbi:MAG: sortase [Micropruina sp.]
MQHAVTPPRRAVPSARRHRPSLVLVAGLMSLLAGAGLLGFYLWQAYLDPVVDTVATQREVQVLKQQWSAEPTPEATTASSPLPDRAVALLRVPEFGSAFEVSVLAGTSEAALSRGVGWFDGSAPPGGVGNFAVAGHRGKDGPFVPLLDLHVGAIVEVETQQAIFTYRLTNEPSQLTVDKHDTWVLDSVPGEPAARPTKALITLITCRNFFHSPERSVAFGELVGVLTK